MGQTELSRLTSSLGASRECASGQLSGDASSRATRVNEEMQAQPLSAAHVTVSTRKFTVTWNAIQQRFHEVSHCGIHCRGMAASNDLITLPALLSDSCSHSPQHFQRQRCAKTTQQVTAAAEPTTQTCTWLDTVPSTPRPRATPLLASLTSQHVYVCATSHMNVADEAQGNVCQLPGASYGLRAAQLLSVDCAATGCKALNVPYD